MLSAHCLLSISDLPLMSIVQCLREVERHVVLGEYRNPSYPGADAFNQDEAKRACVQFILRFRSDVGSSEIKGFAYQLNGDGTRLKSHSR